MDPIHVAHSQAVALSVDDAYAATLPVELPEIFRRWYGPIPAIKQIRDQVGSWATPGETRTIVLAGGATMHEQLTQLDPPSSFSYQLTKITGPFGVLVDHVDGRWAFAAAGAGTQVTWSWTLHPRSGRTRPGVVLLGSLWKGYARRSLDQLARHLPATS